MRSRTPADLPGRCPRCYVMAAWCMCAEIPVVHNRTRVVVIRHAFEAVKSTNTARAASLALGNFEIVDWEPASPPDVDALLAALGRAWLLYPGESTADEGTERPDALVVLDGTWRQARKMLRSHPGLWKLPRLSLPSLTGPVLRLREGPSADARSTLESIAHALSKLEGREVGEPLDRFHSVMVERVLRARGMTDRL